ncbi:hypothetical protein ACWDUD_15300 [Rhodococcus sp. NPDC003382]|nr:MULTISPECIES: hypothetical protein [unclassified Rhodococcus (in: high G+C Gram-positive bacteria)]
MIGSAVFGRALAALRKLVDATGVSECAGDAVATVAIRFTL